MNQTTATLGRLKERGPDVHELAVQELKGRNPTPTKLHHNLLRLFPDEASLRLVTTNFDTLFEEESKNVFHSQPDVYTAPALPLGSSFCGIVHIHGAVNNPSDMVLTDADFGRAYLTEGWARRFLVELFRRYNVLFVGYSHNDIVLNYLARALPPSRVQRFALAGESQVTRWSDFHVTPIGFPQRHCTDYSALTHGVDSLANHRRRRILDWQREISELAEDSPPINEERADLLEYALSKPSLTEFFVASATHHDWIDWLHKRGLLNRLFDTSELETQDRKLGLWLAQTFAMSHANLLFLLIAKNNMHVNPDFWGALHHSITSSKTTNSQSAVLARWASLLLMTLPPNTPSYSLVTLGRHCVKANLAFSVVDLFDELIAMRFVVKRGFTWAAAPTDKDSPSIDIEVSTSVDDEYVLNEVWEAQLKPNLSKVCEPLLSRVVIQLENQNRAFRTWNEDYVGWDPVSIHRSAIEPHEQDSHQRDVDVLIEAARDCLAHFASEQPDAAAYWCDRLVASPSPILRRLAIHTLAARVDMSDDERISWIIDRVDIHDSIAKHEIFQAVRSIYPGACEPLRAKVVATVLAFRAPATATSDHQRNNARRHFDWLHWLHHSNPGCTITKDELTKIKSQHPDFLPQEHPDFTSWMESGEWVIDTSPWSAKELLSAAPDTWMEQLLTYQQADFDGPTREGLLEQIEEAARNSFLWGIDLAKTLMKHEHWTTDIWVALIRSWGQELDKDKHGMIICKLQESQLYPAHVRLIADYVYALIKPTGVPYAAELLPLTDQVARQLWPHSESNQPSVSIDCWVTQAINHPAGVVAQYWMRSLSLWRSIQSSLPYTIPEVYRSTLETICRNRSLAGRYGRTIMALNLNLLLASDEDWTKDNLTPWLRIDVGKLDDQAFWDGLLFKPLSPEVADLIRGPFLDAIRTSSVLFDSDKARHQFIFNFVRMVVHFVDDVIDTWIPSFFQNSDSDTHAKFALQLGMFIANMDDVQQRELWVRWLRDYWINRIHGVPVPLAVEETVAMLSWTPSFKSTFPEAVELSKRLEVRTGSDLQRMSRVLYSLVRAETWRVHAEETADFLILLRPVLLSSHSRKEILKLIEKVRRAGLSEEVEYELQEITVELS